MWYDTLISVPANTAQTSAQQTVIKVTHGVITRVSFRPRVGNNNVLHAQVRYHDHQLWPVSRNEDLHLEQGAIEWTDYEELFTPPYELVVIAWNTSTLYAHAFDLGFALLPERIVAPTNWSQVMRDIVSLLSPRRIFGGGL